MRAAQSLMNSSASKLKTILHNKTPPFFFYSPYLHVSMVICMKKRWSSASHGNTEPTAHEKEKWHQSSKQSFRCQPARDSSRLWHFRFYYSEFNVWFSFRVFLIQESERKSCYYYHSLVFTAWCGLADFWFGLATKNRIYIKSIGVRFQHLRASLE